MEFNKCSRCGNFYISQDDVCPKCKAKDELEFSTFKTYVEENGIQGNIDFLANSTGIASKNISRYMDYAGLKFGDSNPEIKL